MPALVAAFAAGIVIAVLLGPAEAGTTAHYAISFSVAAAYLAAELVVVQLLVAKGSSRSALRLIRGNAVRQAPLLGAQLSASVLAVVIFPYMGAWGLALVVVLLLLIRQSYAMLLDIRETYRTTVEVLVEAAEGSDSRRRGHSERTAEIAREIGAYCGLAPSEIETISYAALLHDLDALGEEDGARRSVCRPSEVLRGVRSFERTARILQIFEGEGSGIAPTEGELLSAYVVALATDIDAIDNKELRLLHGRPALDRLSQDVPQQAKARVVASALRLGYRVPAVP